MTNHQLLYLSRADVESVGLEMPAVIDLLEQAYLEKSRGKVQAPSKPSVYPQADATIGDASIGDASIGNASIGDAFITAMPAYIPSLSSAGIKWISGFPGNPQRGLPYITGLLVLNAVDTGLPYAVMDCTWITAQRTGAKTAIAAKYLASPDSQVVGIVACGVQGRTNLNALACIFPIRKVFVYDISQQAQRLFVQDMQSRYDFEFVSVDSAQAAVMDSDIVVTSGPILKKTKATIQKDWLKPGGFASAVDYDSYWSRAALEQLDIIATDDLAQFLYQRQMGYFENTRDPNLELADLVAGNKPGRQNTEQRILAMNLGLAMDDMAVAPEIYRRARERELGVWLTL